MTDISTIPTQQRRNDVWKLQLVDKWNTLAKAVSGGQKRKLCLGISLIGGAKVVFLDERTSGMDVEARRTISTKLILWRRPMF
jgi:ATP-binding cassette subfamily A (ABC1) protein 3